MFQSTHPRGVRLFIPKSNTFLGVSIHAPTRGATKYKFSYFNIIAFQSTHPRGVRQKLMSIILLLPSFNPRTHEGCDFDL